MVNVKYNEAYVEIKKDSQRSMEVLAVIQGVLINLNKYLSYNTKTHNRNFNNVKQIKTVLLVFTCSTRCPFAPPDHFD